MQDVDEKQLLVWVKEKSLTEVVLFYWLGRWPEENEAKILEEMMVLVVDHGDGSPSAQATIGAGEAGEDLLRSVEAGVSKIDASHGGAIEGLMKIFYEDNRSAEELVKAYLGEGKRIPGFGHRVYTDFDPRTKYLFSRIKELGISEKWIERAKKIEAELEKQKGKKLVMNVDCGMAVVLVTLGVKAELANGFFLWPRVAGLIYRFGESRK